ncbi:MAG TPA: sigma-70 family RNA polymerase sigma factor [Polyangia bacterium]
MNDQQLLAEQFETHRDHLRGIAYRMLGSTGEADDAVQEAWLRLGRAEPGSIETLGGWLTTVVARVCLDLLRSRKSRRAEPMAARVPDPIVSTSEEEALLAESIGLALLVVLETLAPAERLAFVLHDMFGVSFEEIAPIVERTPTAARQLASRARRRVQGAATPDADRARQNEVVSAFLAAAHGGDFAALVAVLDPDVVLRADRGAGETVELRGAETVARNASLFHKLAPANRVEKRAWVNGGPGTIVFVDGEPFSIVGFTIAGGRIVEMDILADPARLARLALPPM